ncbi:NAD(P)-binding domain-containing protein [Streptomyces sp. SID9727]|uniref:NAD(P)-binding domain-containing protein n=1 Tax=Streptomyces sp. SID9727 TaxID=2706114 RepID=UPI0013CB7084|nr:NAD(P)-binding domain-containing protein [Streptomyces sp. SID9727]
MKIAVLGTGMFGRALAGRLSALGHDVVIGTRDVEQTLARAEPDAMGNVPFGQWQGEHPAVRLLTFTPIWEVLLGSVGRHTATPFDRGRVRKRNASSSSSSICGLLRRGPPGCPERTGSRSR